MGAIRRVVLSTGRSAVRRLPDNAKEKVKQRFAELQGLTQLKLNQAMLAKRIADLEGPAGEGGPEVPDPRFPAGVRSRLCTQAQLSEPWFAAWSAAMGEPALAHRKHWEFAYIARVLDALGQLEPGRRGLGFGVGREPLVSAFASRGVEVVATDLDPGARQASGWLRSDQHAQGAVEDMLRPEVCDPESFRRLVSWRAVDMRDIPRDLDGFDFCWSACALEHLGTLQAGVDFVERSLDPLVPGGIAVHTTEYNLSSDTDTVEAGATVIYRERDIHELRARLEGAGHELAAYDLRTGEGVLDHYVDVPPYGDEPVLRFLFAGYSLTSIAFVIRKRPG